MISPIRSLIFGNSGSGKSWLSEQIARLYNVKTIDLDFIHWETDKFNVARDKSIAVNLVHAEAEAETWIIEGVYGWLIREAIPRATLLIWLDIPVDECLKNLKQRGLRRGGNAASFAELLTWAADYPHRQTSSSFTGHKTLFTNFQGQKSRLSCRTDISDYLAACHKF